MITVSRPARLVTVIALYFAAVSPSFGAEPRKATPADKKLSVEALKKKYWQNDVSGTSVSVVQNRAFTKRKKLQVALMGGLVSNDPFLNTQSYGGMLGYHFNETIGIHALYLRMNNSFSSAHDAFVTASGYGTNSNPIQSMLGGELSLSMLYGKLSLFSVSILHFDLFALAGGGTLQTESGNTIAPWIGIGQQLYIAKFLSFRVDYRFFRYTETLYEKYRVETYGQNRGTRTTYAGAITFGFNAFF